MQPGMRTGDYCGDDTTVAAAKRILGNHSQVRLSWTSSYQSDDPGPWFKVYVNGTLYATTRERSLNVPARPSMKDVYQVVEVGPHNGDGDYDPDFAQEDVPADRVRITITASVSEDIKEYRIYSNRSGI